MQEIDIQNKLADWQQRMDKRREAERPASPAIPMVRCKRLLDQVWRAAP